MIGYLRGVVVDRTLKGEITVDVGGVGYRVIVPTAQLSRMIGGTLTGTTEVTLFVHTSVREDAITLYGFPTRDDRTCFELVLTAHGVGPSLALSILNMHTPDSLRTALATDDVDALTAVPGVGKKTAARLLVELKSKLADNNEYDGAIAAAGDGIAATDLLSPTDPKADVRAALSGLGYGTDEIRGVIRKLSNDTTDSSALLKQALTLLATGG
jgi:holliday junction DNA helicase RuvA